MQLPLVYFRDYTVWLRRGCVVHKAIEHNDRPLAPATPWIPTPMSCWRTLAAWTLSFDGQKCDTRDHPMSRPHPWRSREPPRRDACVEVLWGRALGDRCRGGGGPRTSCSCKFRSMPAQRVDQPLAQTKQPQRTRAGDCHRASVDARLVTQHHRLVCGSSLPCLSPVLASSSLLLEYGSTTRECDAKGT